MASALPMKNRGALTPTAYRNWRIWMTLEITSRPEEADQQAGERVMKSKHSEHTPNKYERVPGRDFHSDRDKQVRTAHEGARANKPEKEKSNKR
jgi:hypothetical protein